jgi:Ca-activated chloride channel family protein
MIRTNRASTSCKTIWKSTAVFAALILSCPPAAISQQTAVPATTVPITTAPETQPSLTQDRDPIPSPDPPSNSTVRGSRSRVTFTQTVDEVFLNASVYDSGGHLIGGLGQSDFQVYEDGVLQKITSFHREDVPVSLGILIDNSASMYDKRQAVDKAALDLVKSSNPDDEDFVVNFSDAAYLDTDFTSDVNKLNQGLSHIDSRGGTALYDAVVAAADHEAEKSHRHKEVLLVITDGADNSSTSTLDQTIRRVQDLSGPVVYSIGLLFGDEDSSRSKRESKKALISLTEQTGGLALFPKSLNDVDAIASTIAKDIRSQYTIGYTSTKPPSQGGFRAVHVEVKAKGYNKLSVRTRAGYFPKPDAQPAAGQTDADRPSLPATH